MTQYYVDKNGFIIIPKENPKPKKDITIEEYFFLLIKNLKPSTIKKRTNCLAEKIFSDWTSGFFSNQGWTLEKVISTAETLIEKQNKSIINQ